ncbi:hypothetical protein SESBI_11035 [Sesbania bispinosa]|nr:hypothetical protein SESBI_11035 [Sesbania bispinosa]
MALIHWKVSIASNKRNYYMSINSFSQNKNHNKKRAYHKPQPREEKHEAKCELSTMKCKQRGKIGLKNTVLGRW